MATTETNNIWSDMGYTIPRGQCGHKTGLMSSKCPCNRFMMHPSQLASSFLCDACSHHAGFHDLEPSPIDDAAIALRAREAATKQQFEARARRLDAREAQLNERQDAIALKEHRMKVREEFIEASKKLQKPLTKRQLKARARQRAKITVTEHVDPETPELPPNGQTRRAIDAPPTTTADSIVSAATPTSTTDVQTKPPTEAALSEPQDSRESINSDEQMRRQRPKRAAAADVSYANMSEYTGVCEIVSD